jgi:hypothetical protein
MGIFLLSVQELSVGRPGRSPTFGCSRARSAARRAAPNAPPPVSGMLATKSAPNLFAIRLPRSLITPPSMENGFQSTRGRLQIRLRLDWSKSPWKQVTREVCSPLFQCGACSYSIGRQPVHRTRVVHYVRRLARRRAFRKRRRSPKHCSEKTQRFIHPSPLVNGL